MISVVYDFNDNDIKLYITCDSLRDAASDRQI